MTTPEIASWIAWCLFWGFMGFLLVKLYYALCSGPREDTDENDFTQHDWQCIIPIIRAKSEGHHSSMMMKINMDQLDGKNPDWNAYLNDDYDPVQETINEWKIVKKGRKS